jgi:poly-gamma-glutamate synthesis protein (capsule biosynthesis protein)
MIKKIFYTILIITIGMIGFFGGNIFSKKIHEQVKQTGKAQVVETLPKEIAIPKETTLYFVGDMMLTRSVGTSVKKNFDNDFNKLFDNIPEIKEADILFGNLEGPVSLIGNNVGSKYSFRMDPSVLPAIKNAGFDIVSFANNHVGDWNVNAFKDTLANLDNINLPKIGAGMSKQEAETPVIIKKNGVKFGYLGFSDVGPSWMEAKENKAGILLASDPLIREIITNAKEKVDVLIISFHWGDEYKTVHNSHQEKLARMAIDYGADMVIGHHPHVAQDIEIYKDKPIVYSLGNFIFDQYFSKETMKGMLFEATFDGNLLKKTENKIITLNKKYQLEGIFKEEEIKEKEDIASIACPKPTKYYEDMSLLPVDQDTNLPDITYIPNDLRELDENSSTKKGICLKKEARNSFELMAQTASKEGISIKVSSGFRSYEGQKATLAAEIKKGNPDALIAVAKAGYSEHQLGTAVDVTGQSIKYLSASDTFEKTDEAKWMEENARDFGFVESYPLGKENETGYQYEPWHYRYVGIDMAKEIIKKGQTIVEYLENLQ